MDGGIAAANQGHDVVMTPTSHCYFDYYQGKTGEPKAWGGFLPLETVYAFEPTPPALSAEKAKHILARAGNLWSEIFPTTPMCNTWLIPRLRDGRGDLERSEAEELGRLPKTSGGASTAAEGARR